MYCATTWDGDIKQISALRLCHLFILEKSMPLRHFFLPTLRNHQALSETIELDKVTRLDVNPVAACFLFLSFPSSQFHSVFFLVVLFCVCFFLLLLSR